MSGYVPLPAPVTANPDFWNKGLEGLNALRDTQAKQAIAGIYQQSTDPATGQVDPAKFNLLISRNPQAAWAAGPAMQQQGQAAGAQGQGTLEQVAAHRARMDTMLGLMNGVLAKGGPIGIGDIQTALNQAHLSPTESAQVSQDANAAAGGDPNYDFTNWVKNHQASNLTVQQQIAVRTPNMQFHNIGGRLVPVDMNGQTNPNPGSLITTLSPGEATQIVKVDMGDGTTQQMPLSDAVTKLSTNPAMKILGPVAGGATSLNAAGDSATRKAAEGGPPAAGTPAAAVAQRTHDFWISQGYNETQVAGILAGGPGSESDFTPAAGGDKVNGVATSIGLYQHHGPRLHNAQGTGLLDRYGPNPTADQQNEYAAWEISPQGPLAAVGAALKAAKTPAEAATIWTRDFGVPADKSEILRRANGAQRFVGIYGQPPQGAAPAASTAPPAAPAGPPGVQMGGAPPPPPWGAPGAYTGGGVGAALAPGGTANPVVVRGTPLPAARLSGDVGAMVQGMQLAQANPLQAGSGAMVAGPGAPTGNNALQPPSVEPPPQPGWGRAVGTYSGGPGPATAPTAPAQPAAPAVPVAAPAAPAQPAPIIGRSAPLGTGERVQADIGAYTKDAGGVATHQGAINTLQNAYKALQLADTGPGTQNLQAARAFLQSFGIATSATGDQATQWAEAHKYLMDYARTQGLLGGTDLQAQLAQGSNASTDIPKPAALAVVRNNIAKERMGIAQVMEAQGSTGYVDHTKTFAPGQDIRAYQADIMPPAELKEIEGLQKTNPAAFKKFQKSLDIARAHGLISDEDLAAQNQRIRAMGR